MAAIAAMLWTLTAWRLAPLWWAAYSGLQYLTIRAPSAAKPSQRFEFLFLCVLAYAVAGFPAWHLWTGAGDLGIAAATMFLCGMLVQLVVSSLASRGMFWACASPLIAYLICIPPLAFGSHRLAEGLAASICAVLFVAYVALLWHGQKRALDALQASRLKARAASEAKTDFLAAMSHELRTPMNAVLAATDLLGRTHLTEEQTGYLSMLSDGGAVLMHVLNDVLDLAKIEAGKLSINPVSTNVHDLVRRCAALWEPQARDKSLDFTVSISPHVPEYLIIDLARTGQIAFNLISNSLKFTPRGSVALSLNAAERENGECELIMSVRDTGIGISPEAQSRLFKAFEQADGSISRRFGGTGLGLSISQNLARMMGGHIEMSSTEGVGSTFTFCIACALGEKPPAPKTDQLKTVDRLSPSTRILVAEDNTSNQRIIDLFLRPIGADVTIVSDGQQALEVLNIAPFDLVLMDIQMPLLDGLEATRRLRAGRGPNAGIPVLALTANVSEDQRMACFNAGMNGHVAKPIDARVLISSVFNALDATAQTAGLKPERLVPRRQSSRT